MPENQPESPLNGESGSQPIAPVPGAVTPPGVQSLASPPLESGDNAAYKLPIRGVPAPRPPSNRSFWIFITVFFVVGLGVAALVLFGLRSNGGQLSQALKLKNQSLDSQVLSGLAPQVPASGSYAVGGDLSVTGIQQASGLVLIPSASPVSPKKGQIYFDQATHQLNYFDGSNFVNLLGGSDNITQLVQIGPGLAYSSGHILNTGVVTLQAGNGIAVNGATITNTGVTNLTSPDNSIGITKNASGTYQLTVQGTGSGSVTSLNGLTGALTVANSSGSGSTVTIDDASTSAKGIAQFDATNFSVSGGLVNTIQGIAVSSSPTFAGLTLSSALTVGNGGTGSTTAAGALTNLGAAASGNNSDILTLDHVTSVRSTSGLNVGWGSAPLALEGDGSTYLSATDSGFTNTLNFETPTSGNTISIPDETGDICLQSSPNCGFAASSGSANYIQNQNASDQTANFRISGSGRANTSILTPLLDTASAATLNVGTTNANGISIGNASSNTVLQSAGGRVGIGIGSPNATLEVNGASWFDSTILSRVTAGDAISLNNDSGGTVNIVTGGTNGTKIGTATNQKLAFFNSTPIVQPAATTDLRQAIINLGLLASGGATPLDLNGGALTATAATLSNASSLTLGQASTNTGSILFKGSGSANTITLQGPTSPSNNTITLPDETGTICLQNSSNCGFATTSSGAFIQNQNASDQTADFRISGTGRANTSILTPVLDTATAGSLTIGSTNATAINLGNTSSNILTTLNGTVLAKPTTGNDSTTAFQVQRAGGASVLTVDTTNSQLKVQGINSVATIGSELLSGNCSGTNWSGTGSGPYTHTSGSTASLTCTISGGVVAGTTYRISYDFSSTQGNSELETASIGGVSGVKSSGSPTGFVTNVTTINTNNPTFDITASGETGSITNISFKQVTVANNLVAVKNSDSTSGIEVRSGGSGLSNTFIGLLSGQSVTTGNFNSAYGAGALQANLTGGTNSAFGYQALQGTTSGSSNVAMGYQAMQSASSSNNVGIGYQALQSDIAGGNNVAIGYQAYQSGYRGGSNVAIGYQALNSSGQGAGNVAIGSQAAKVSNGNNNVSIGLSAMVNNNLGGQNTAVGASALQANTNGVGDTAFGYFALGNINGSFVGNNTGVGYQAGYQDPTVTTFTTLATGTNMTMLGYGAQGQLSNSLILGGQGANAVNVGIGTTSPTNTFSVSPDQYDTGTAGTGGSSSTTITGSGTTWTAAMVGSEFIFADGTKRTITAVGSTTSLTVNSAVTEANGKNYRIHRPAFQVTSTGKLGVNVIAPSADIDVKQLADGDNMLVLKRFTDSSPTGSFFKLQDATGADLVSIDISGNLTVKAVTVNGTLTVNGHVISGNSSGSTTASTLSGCGVGCTASVSGNDTAGTITLGTGTGAISGSQFTFSFANAYGANPHIVFSPGSNWAGTVFWYDDTATNTSTVTVSATSITSSSTYKIEYHVFQ